MTISYRGLTLHYTADRAQLGGLAERFSPSALDEATRRWIDQAFARPASTQALMIRAIARHMLSDYDANALSDTFSMHQLSTEGWRALLEPAPPTGGALLDIGAGDGRVTQTLAPLFTAVHVTETAKQMRKRLASRGFAIAPAELSAIDARFDVVALLNVIDRTARPITLLKEAARLLKPRGRLVVAAPLPLKPHVHVGPITLDPEELLPWAPTWEAQALALDESVFSPLHLQTLRLTRAPYLSHGGAAQPVSALDGSIWVLAKKSVSCDIS